MQPRSVKLIKTGGQSCLIHRTDLKTPLVHKKVNLPTAKSVSPKIELETAKALAVFQALQRIREEDGDDVFDSRTLRYMKSVEEALKLENEPEGFSSRYDGMVIPGDFKLEKYKLHQRGINTVKRSVQIAWDLLSPFLFKTPQKLDVDKLIRDVQEHLQMDDSELPRSIAIDPPFLRQVGGAAGYYNPQTDEFGLTSEITPLLVAAARSINPSLERLVDMLPRSITDGLTYLYRDSPVPKLITSHELTHKRQMNGVMLLTHREAYECLIDIVNNLSNSDRNLFVDFCSTLMEEPIPLDKERFIVDSVFEVCLPRFQDSRDIEVSSEELEKAKLILQSFVLASVFGGHRDFRETSSGMRRYISNSCEVEARLESNAYLIQEDFDLLANAGRVTFTERPRVSGAIGLLRGFILDRAINSVLMRIEAMKSQGVEDPNIEKEEDKLWKLYKLNGWSITGEQLFMEKRYKAMGK